MTRVTSYSFGISPPSSGRSVKYWSGLCLLILLNGSVLAQDLAVPAVAASRPSVAVDLLPIATPAAKQLPSASGTLSTASAPAQAKPAAAANSYRWKSLSAAQRQALAPLEKEWSHIDLQRRLKWLEIASRFSSLPADEQARMQERMSSWAELSPVERSRARLIFQQAQQITPESRQAKWEAYQALAPEQRQDLADKAAKRTLETNAPSGAMQAKHERHLATATKPALADQAKSNLVPDRASAPLPKSVTPLLLQKKPGVTTTLINQTATPPAHQQSGMTKIVAAPDVVDSRTLLPKRAITSASAPEPAVAIPPRQ